MKSPPGEKTGARTATAADKSSGESARGRQGMTHVLSSFRTASRGGVEAVPVMLPMECYWFLNWSWNF